MLDCLERKKGARAAVKVVSATTGAKPSDLDRERLADLVEAVAQKRDRAAFAALFAFYAPRVKGYLLRQGAGDAVAEDVTQDVMVTIWRRAETFDRRQASVSTWVFTVARNRRIDLIRRERRPALDPNDPLLVVDPEPEPDHAVDASQRAERLHAAIATLPAEQADLLKRAFFRGVTHSELAAETGLPLGTIKSRLRLAFGRLRRALDGQV